MHDTKIDYEAMVQARADALQLDLQSELEKQLEGGPSTAPIQSLQHAILHFITTNNYEMAIGELERYVTQQDPYPDFRARTAHYVKHCMELIRAIEVKRSFPQFATLSRPKQQELMDRVKQHFEELKFYLRKIEQVERGVRRQDARSSILVIGTLFHTAFFVVGYFFIVDLHDGLAAAAFRAFEDLVTRVFRMLPEIF